MSDIGNDVVMLLAGLVEAEGELFVPFEALEAAAVKGETHAVVIDADEQRAGFVINVAVIPDDVEVENV